jgi:catechol 2,3-dioxygenase-like lactoylglutathione lyase family enzyme
MIGAIELYMRQNPADLFTRLAPVLNVRDVAAEREFYGRLGFPVIYEGQESADFIAFGTEQASPPSKSG